MSSSTKILPNPTRTPLRGRAIGCPCGRAEAHDRARRQKCRETQRTLFLAALRLSSDSVKRSADQTSMSRINAALFLLTLVVLSL